MKIADRITRLGTETAFAVSAEAAAFAAEGHAVYPFHLGDINLMTPVNVREAAFKAMQDGKTGYCPNTGIPQLREALAADVGSARQLDYSAENVVIQPGGKPTIGKFFLTLMNPGDEVLYPTPGYPIYESQIEFHGGIAKPYRYVEGAEDFEIDVDMLVDQITPKTRLLVLNDLQNPTGAECTTSQLEQLAEIAIEHDLYVLCDEAYFDIRYSGQTTSLASQPGMRERCVILYTFSKKFAMTGWRLGATIGPRDVIEVIAKLNVNDESCANHFIQFGALEGLTGDQTEVVQNLEILQNRRDLAVDLLNDIDGIRCFRPNATFYLFANVTEAMKHKDVTDVDQFRQLILRQTGVSVCTRNHFGRPVQDESESYIRLAYSGIDADQIQEGLTRFKAFIEE